MKVLDCETVATIYQSIEQISGVDEDALNKFLLQIPEDELFPGYSNPDDILLKKFRQKTKSTCEPDAICWFHLTRAAQHNSFEEGILPLGQSINRVWDFLFSLVQDDISGEQWKEFQSKVETGKLNHSSRLYQMKVSNSLHWGPYATLIREFGFMANKLPIHDYLRTPEIVEDIAICFEEIYSIDLLQRFMEVTSPCIVKFVNYEDEPDIVGIALYYIYILIHNSELSIMCNTYIDKKGIAIPRDQIIKIEFPQYTEAE